MDQSTTFIGNKWTKQKEGYPPGVLTSTTELQPLTGMTLPEFVFRNTHKWEDAISIKCAETGRMYTFGQVKKLSQNFAGALLKAGFKRRDPIGVLLPNVPEYPILTMGIMQAGCVICPINPSFSQDELSRHIQSCRVKGLITTSELATMAESVKVACPYFTEKIIVLDKVAATTDAEYHNFFEMVKDCKSSDLLLTGSQMDADFPCILAYSSGTTGLPKAVLHTHASIICSLKQQFSPEFCQTKMASEENGQDVFATVIPFFHLYGLGVILPTAIHHGVLMHCISKFMPQIYKEVLLEHKPTTLHLVTPLINFLAQDPSFPPDALANCRGIFIGAAPVGHELMKKFTTKFGQHIFLQEAYGSTELLAVTMVPKEIHNEISGSSGVLMPGVTCKVVDVDTGKILGPNQRGEICFQTGSMMNCYLGNDEATKFAIREQNFFYSGDIGYYTEHGFYYVVDRLKDLIKVNAFQVSPSELEDVLRQLAGVTDVAVVGVQHERMGEAPRAYIVREGETLTEDDIHTFLKPRLAPFKQLAGGIEFVTEIPKNPAGKILRKDLRDKFNGQHKQ